MMPLASEHTPDLTRRHRIVDVVVVVAAIPDLRVFTRFTV
jgi:hypothetical protein